MKIKHIALYTLIALFTTSAWAQKKDKKMSYERLRAMKINFVIEKVDLTTEEESFVWGAFEAYETRVFNKYHKKMKSLRKKRLANIEEVSEAGANETLDSIIHFRSEKEKNISNAFECYLRTHLSNDNIKGLDKQYKYFKKELENSFKKDKNYEKYNLFAYELIKSFNKQHLHSKKLDLYLRSIILNKEK